MESLIWRVIAITTRFMLSLASHVTEPPFPVSEENMMLYTWHTIKGWVAAALAFVTCPCHSVSPANHAAITYCLDNGNCFEDVVGA
jgi:hypothetical protein